VRSLIADDVLRTDDAWEAGALQHHAGGLGAEALSPPPITPASAMAPAESAITRFEESRV